MDFKILHLGLYSSSFYFKFSKSLILVLLVVIKHWLSRYSLHSSLRSYEVPFLLLSSMMGIRSFAKDLLDATLHYADVTETLLVEVDQIYHLACPASPVFYKHNPVKVLV